LNLLALIDCTLEREEKKEREWGWKDMRNIKKEEGEGMISTFFLTTLKNEEKRSG
jgi:hypothetical protein